jgi:hypothetical protein
LPVAAVCGAAPNRQAKWQIDVHNTTNSLPQQAQNRLKQRHQTMTLLKNAMPSGKPIKESDWYERLATGMCPRLRHMGQLTSTARSAAVFAQ